MRSCSLPLAALALAATGCHKSAPAPSPALRFLPPGADIGLRIDLTRARAWAGYAKLAPLAFQAVQPSIDAVKRACGFDLIGDASSIALGRHGLGPGSDLALVIAGLPRDKVTACPAKLGGALPGLEIVPDGDRFVVNRDGKGYASGAVLPGGELVLVSRAAASVEPAAWRDEVSSGAGTIPAWWSELDQGQPFAVRLVQDKLVITASAELGDPLVIRGKVVAPDAGAANIELGRLKAIVDFLTKAEAGTGRLEPRGEVIHGDFTATGPQIDRLLAAVGSSIGGGEAEAAAAPPPDADADTPIECAALGAAVQTYLTTSQIAMPPEQHDMMSKIMVKLSPALQQAYVDSCTKDHWATVAIHCHVDHAAELPKFEKCRLALPADQRTSFDQTVAAALASAR